MILKNRNVWLLIIMVCFLVFFNESLRTQAFDPKAPLFQPDETASATHKPSNAKQDLSQNNDPMISTDLLIGNVDPGSHEEFVLIETRYASRPGMYMHREAYETFTQMHQAAAEEGIDLVIISAMRTFSHQKRIWNEKWNGRRLLEGNIQATDIADPVERAREILRFSAMPGTSRHHWGTDIDLNSLVNSYFEKGKGKQIYEWLVAHASGFGFCQPYTAFNDARTSGFEEEKWHWSYRPVAARYLEAFKNSIDYTHIRGFDGSETAEELKVIEKFVFNIDGECIGK